MNDTDSSGNVKVKVWFDKFEHSEIEQTCLTMRFMFWSVYSFLVKIVAIMLIWFLLSWYLLMKVSNGSTRTICKICSKLMIKVINDIIDVVLVSIIYIYIVNFEQITHCSSVSIAEFEQVNVDQVYFNMHAVNGSNTSRRPIALQSKKGPNFIRNFSNYSDEFA